MSCSAETGIIVMNLNTFVMRREDLDVYGLFPMYAVGRVNYVYLKRLTPED